MGDDTEPATGACGDLGILPSASTRECGDSSPVHNSDRLGHAADPDETHVASTSTSGYPDVEPSAADNAEHLECAADLDEVHAEVAIVADPKRAAFICNECALSFRWEKEFLQHQRNKHNQVMPGTLWCSYCEYCTTSRNNYNRHTLSHTSGKRYTCEECQKKFSRRDHLVSHGTTHTKEKKFRCSTCNRSFGKRWNLVRHESFQHRADDTKLNTCESCGRCFVRADNLARHQIVHTRERRYGCEKCLKRFAYLGGLKRHVTKLHPLTP